MLGQQAPWGLPSGTGANKPQRSQPGSSHPGSALAVPWLFQVLFQVLGPSQENRDTTLPPESCRSGEDTQEAMSSFQGRDLRGNQNGTTRKASFRGRPPGSQAGRAVWDSGTALESLLSDLPLTLDYCVESCVTSVPSGHQAPRGLGTVSALFIISPQPDR